MIKIIKFWEEWLKKDSIEREKQMNKIITKHTKSWIKMARSKKIQDKYIIHTIQMMFNSYCEDLYAEMCCSKIKKTK